MFKIGIRSFISIISSKFVRILSEKLYKGGSNFPGTVALKIKKDILKDLTKNYKVILITGTNGKTTTSSMLYNMIKESGNEVITNETGANMLPGIVATFARHYNFFRKSTNKFAVIEADEANVKFLTEHINPEIITITNLFRDQLDRYGEVYTTLNIILDGVKKAPTSKLVLNGDESLLGELDLPNPIVYYGFNNHLYENKKIDINADAKFCKKCHAPYSYNFVTYNHLGDFYCDNCGYKRPELKYYVNDVLSLTSSESSVKINNKEYLINQGGAYNIYNGLCAYSIASEIGISTDIIEKSLRNQKSSFGRQEIIDIEGTKVKIILVKNPAGYDEALNTITFDNKNFNLAFLLNDNYADGRDISWIWDVNFEKLKDYTIDNILIGGIRKFDMAVRLKTAELNKDNFKVCDDFEMLLSNIKTLDKNQLTILSTYTAMTSFRKFLLSKGYIKKLW